MPSSYTTSLRLTLPATGELSGQWGNTVNTGITELLDAAVAGTTTISTWGGAGVAYTLSNNSGTADEARRMFIVATGSPGEAKNVICPAVSKFYVFRNDTTGGFALTLKTPSGTGISVPAGQYRFLYCDGTNVVEMFNSVGSLTLGTALAASSGGTGQSTYTVGDLIYATGTTALSKLGIGASTTILTSSGTAPQWTSASSVSIGTATNLAGGLAGSVPYQSGAATTTFLSIGAANTVMTSSGTAPQWSTALTGLTGVSTTTATLSGNLTLSGGTANGVLYLNGSKVATSGSALTFDGTSLTFGSTAQRIIGDFSNATISNRLMFQSSTLNGATRVHVIPNGTGNTGAFAVLNSSDANNASWLQIQTTSTVSQIAATISGTGTYLPLVIATGGVEVSRFTTTGDLLIGTTSAVSGSKLVVDTGDATIYGVRVGRGAGAVSSNTAVGSGALAANTTGNYQVAVGYRALYVNTTGLENTALGGETLLSNLSGGKNTAVGVSTLSANTSGSNNTGLGRGALQANTTADGNTAVGYLPLFTNTTGANNVAVGMEALRSNTTASNNTAVGYQAGYTNSTGTENSYFGTGAGGLATSSYNTGIGYYAVRNATANENVGVGWSALRDVTSGAKNTAVGGSSGYLITTGSSNTVLGRYNGNQGGLDIRTASNYIVLSDGDGNPRQIIDSSGNLGLGVAPSAWISTAKALDINTLGAVFSGSGVGVGLSSNSYVGASNRVYKTTAAATDYWQLSGEHRWFTAPSGTAGNAISFTQAMTLDASGNLLIGTTSGSNKLTVNGDQVLLANGQLKFADAGNSQVSVIKNSGASGTSRIEFLTGNPVSERMRIDGNGYVLMGVTTANGTGGVLQLSSGITFPATQSASSDANTLDDYEEGTWTPTQGAGLTVVGAFSSGGTYTKIGRQVTVNGFVGGATSVALTAGGIICGGLPFAAATSNGFGSGTNAAFNVSIATLANAGSSNVYGCSAITANANIYFSTTYIV